MLQFRENGLTVRYSEAGNGETIVMLHAGGTSSTHWRKVVPHLQARYDSTMVVRDVVISGFFDSVGLYRTATSWKLERFTALAARLGIASLASTRFDRLSEGERMLVLIARAMIKGPKVLLLDEPCSGLDPERRAGILAALDDIGSGSSTDIVYVTHHRDEIPACVDRILELTAGR